MLNKCSKNKYNFSPKATSYKLQANKGFTPTPLRQQADGVSPAKAGRGFTLMEILVATTIFATVVASLMALFNYTLKINRRSEALRQATQGMRNFVEFMVKEVRNGQIDYGLVDPGGQVNSSYPLGPCTGPTGGAGHDTYQDQDNKLAVLTPEGSVECLFLAYGPDNKASPVKATGTPVATGVFGTTADNPHPILAMIKSTNRTTTEILNPPSISLQNLKFIVRPLCDPYTATCSGTYSGYPKIEPTVVILARFLVTLPTGEQTSIYYQTAVTSNNYDIPSN